ncbi:phasin family protein [Bifidobacterium pullorum subsp. saeculare]|uniref:Phasin family protein n=1 Tax=Bifidobacterium pullorum subsp. saeculare TaxID=78257 RepID=A0A938WWI9_9BIFI|nr:phasin family protein [Bifidobacterium pullorum]MBM6700195.1 phasin family protein [Bifidobacterium pullorum subsp. saeculare]
MADFDLGDGLRKVFLAGVGAMATTFEKGQEIVNDLVKKGELTVEQGKALNTELRHRMPETVKEAKAAAEATAAAKTAEAAQAAADGASGEATAE